jgi:predicted deacetylase
MGQSAGDKHELGASSSNELWTGTAGDRCGFFSQYRYAKSFSPMTPRDLVVSLHDVSPPTHAACAAILEKLAALGVPRMSLLVIPDHHHRGHFLGDAKFCTWLQEQAAEGHEVVIHGYHHRRTRRADESARDKFTTRLYTADEGEFYDLDRPTAAALVTKARAEFEELNLATPGFIAPAWLLSREAEDALRDLGIEYTTRLGSVLDLRRNVTYRSQSLVWSVRSGWRRWTSLRWNAFLFRRLATNPLLRISIHPVDLHHAKVWQQIAALVARALADRQPLTYHAWLARQHG